MSRNKKNVILSIILVLMVGLAGIWSVQKVGIKDGATFTLSIILSIFIFVLSMKDIKKSIYLFIISMPILVTARKLFYLDLFVLKLNFESLIIIYLCIISFKDIVKKVKSYIDNCKNGMIILKLSVLFIISTYISCFFADSFRESFELVTTSVVIPILLLPLFITIFSKEDIKYIGYSLILSVNLSCFYGFAQILGIGLSFSAIKSSKEYLTFGYHNVNIFVNIALIAYPFLLNEILYKKPNKKEKVFLIISFFIQSFALFITFSRGAWLAMALAFVAILFSKKYRVIFTILVILGILLGNSLLPIILNRGSSTSEGFLKNTSNSARVLAILTSGEIMKDNVFGVGYGDFNENYRNYVVSAYYEIGKDNRAQMNAPLYTMDHPHNFFLSIGTELGIISMILIILIFGERILKGIKNYSDNRPILVSLAIFIFIGLTTGIELNHRGVITNTYLLWILFALISVNCKKMIEDM